jgi:hypothetical protein
MPFGREPGRFFGRMPGHLGAFGVRGRFTPLGGLFGGLLRLGVFGLLVFGVVWLARNFKIVRREAQPAAEYSHRTEDEGGVGDESGDIQD